MSADELIAEFKALSWAERRQVADAVLADQQVSLSVGQAALQKAVPQAAQRPTFSKRWSGSFIISGADPSDARLTYLLNRF